MSDDEFQTPPGFPFHPLQVLSDKQLAALEGMSARYNSEAAGKGGRAPRIQLSERRKGTLCIDELEFLKSKRKGSATR